MNNDGHPTPSEQQVVPPAMGRALSDSKLLVRGFDFSALALDFQSRPVSNIPKSTRRPKNAATKRRHSVPLTSREQRRTPTLAGKALAQHCINNNEALRLEQASRCRGPYAVIALLNVAQIHRYQRAFALALTAYEQLLAIQVGLHGPNSIDVARTWSCIGQVHYEARQFEAALEHFAVALDLQRPPLLHDQSASSVATPNSPVDLAATIYFVGLVWLDWAQYDFALMYFSESLHWKGTVVGLGPIDIALVYFQMGRAHRLRGNDVSAIAHFKAAWHVTMGSNAPLAGDPRSEEHQQQQQQLWFSYHDWAVQLLQQIGAAYQSSGDLPQAIDYYSRSLLLERERLQRCHQDSTGSPSALAVRQQSALVVARLLNLIGNLRLQRAEVPAMMECYTEASRLFRDYAAAATPASISVDPMTMDASNGNSAFHELIQTQSTPSEGLIIAGYNYYSQNRLHPSCAPVA